MPESCSSLVIGISLGELAEPMKTERTIYLHGVGAHSDGYMITSRYGGVCGGRRECKFKCGCGCVIWACVGV